MTSEGRFVVFKRNWEGFGLMGEVSKTEYLNSLHSTGRCSLWNGNDRYNRGSTKNNITGMTSCSHLHAGMDRFQLGVVRSFGPKSFYLYSRSLDVEKNDH